jgi:hypothetical protein
VTGSSGARRAACFWSVAMAKRNDGDGCEEQGAYYGARRAERFKGVLVIRRIVGRRTRAVRGSVMARAGEVGEGLSKGATEGG